MQVGILTATSVEEKFRFLSAVTKMACTVVRCDGLSMTCTTRFTCDDWCWLVYTMTHHYWFSHFIFFFLFFPSFTSLLPFSSPLMTVTDQQHLLLFWNIFTFLCPWFVDELFFLTRAHASTRSAGDCQSTDHVLRVSPHPTCHRQIPHPVPVIFPPPVSHCFCFPIHSLHLFVSVHRLSVCVRLWRLGVVSTKFCWHCIAWTLFLYHEMLKKMYYRNNHVLMKNLPLMLLWLLACEWCAWWVCMRERQKDLQPISRGRSTKFSWY